MINQAEKELLIGCARLPLRNFQNTDISEAPFDRLDWDNLIDTARRHGLAPLLFKTITDTGVHDRVPPLALKKLKSAYLSSLLGNQILYRELSAPLAAMAAEEIPVILMKGAALCQTIYSDMALRPFGDLDILVPRDRVEPCRRILADLGFELICGIYFPVSDEDNSRVGCEWSYQHDGKILELHWDLINLLEPFRVDINTFWKGAQPIEISGNNALVMSPEAQLLHLCLHQFKHRWEHLRDLVDISILIEKQGSEIDWRGLAATARSQKLGRCFYYTVNLCHHVLGVETGQLHLENFLSRPRPLLIAQDMQNLMATEILSDRLPRRLWEPLMVQGARSKLSRLFGILAHPFPRADQGRPGFNRETTLSGKLAAPLRSIYFHRVLLLKIPVQLARRAGVFVRMK
ncbi:MAG: nucleotidyltransferase domain-containing protein [Thermoleophilia bacterium]